MRPFSFLCGETKNNALLRTIRTQRKRGVKDEVETCKGQAFVLCCIELKSWGPPNSMSKAVLARTVSRIALKTGYFVTERKSRRRRESEAWSLISWQTLRPSCGRVQQMLPR
jgi:hypothetical protein